MSWTEIGRRLNIHKRTVQRVVLPPLTLKAYNINNLCLDIPRSRGGWHSFESKTLWPPRVTHRCWETRIDCETPDASPGT